MRTLVTITCLLFASTATAQSAQKNILFIGVDDLRVDLGCYGAQYMKTPHIDALAKQGLRFNRAYCQQAICAASRISLMTGLRPDTTGIFDLDHPLNDTLPDAMSMPRFFQANGYRTISLGKIYHHGKDDKAFWDVLDSCSQPTYTDPTTLRAIAEQLAAAKKKKLKGKALRQAAKGPAFENADVSDTTYTDGAIADEAINQLRQKHDRPFFLAVGFKKPHLPFVAPKKYWDLYDPAGIQIPSRESPIDATPIGLSKWGELRSYTGIPSTGDCTDEQSRSLIHGYRACVSYIDAQVGRVLAELDQQGLRESTLIVFWSDHGWKLGEYGDWCKHTNYELDTRVPLIFSGAGIPSGASSNALVEYIDIFPTLTKWCGLQTPTACEGKSLAPLFADPSLPFKTVALSQYPRGGMGYSVRSESSRFTQWRRKDGKVIGEELYDHSTSDVATKNLISEAEHQQEANRLRKLLNALAAPTTN